MRVVSAGNVVFGVSSVARGDLDVTSGADGTSVTKSIHFGYSSADFYGFRIANTNAAGSTYAGTFAIQRGTGAAWSSDLLVNDSGNVGIGATSPSVKLEVAGLSNGATLELLRLNNTGSGANTQAQINFIAATASYATITGGYGSAAPQMTFNLPATGNYVWQVSSSEKMRLDTSGNVGIGTTDPRTKLTITDGGSPYSTYTGLMFDIRRNVSNGSADSNTSLRLGNNSNTFDIRYGGTTDRLGFVAGGSTEVVTFLNGGNVGIGVVNPGQALVVRREGDVRVYVEDDNANGRGGYLRSVTGGAVTLGTTSGVRDLVFAPDNSERMRIAVDGNVGIGTSTTTGVKLTVAGSTAFTFAQFSTAHVVLGSTNSSGSLFVNTPSLNGSFTSGLGIDGSYASTTSTVNISAVGVFSGGGYGGEFAFRTSFEGLTYERMRILKGGNVGIGTDSPAVPLQVRGDASAGGVSITTNTFTSASAGSSLRLRHNATSGNTTAIVENLIAGGTTIGDLALNPSGGNVGIGTASPTEKLDVVGNIELSGSGNRRLTFYSSTNWRYNFASVGDNFNVYDADNTNFLQFFYSGTLAFKRASLLNALHVLQGGSVGIGTTSPIGVFSVKVATNTNFSVGTTGTELLLGAYNDAVSAYVPMQLYASEFNLMSGNVGIGTTNPITKFEVNGGIRTTPGSGGTLTLYDNNSAVSNLLDMGANSSGAFLNATYASGGSGALILQTIGSERMRITQDGTILIGTTTTPTSATTGVLAFGAVGTAPSAVSAGGALYVDSGGILKYRNSTGLYTVTIT
jgi:hypothetical protein